jgi:hypothetical protein
MAGRARSRVQCVVLDTMSCVIDEPQRKLDCRSSKRLVAACKEGGDRVLCWLRCTVLAMNSSVNWTV